MISALFTVLLFTGQTTYAIDYSRFADSKAEFQATEHAKDVRHLLAQKETVAPEATYSVKVPLAEYKSGDDGFYCATPYPGGATWTYSVAQNQWTHCNNGVCHVVKVGQNFPNLPASSAACGNYCGSSCGNGACAPGCAGSCASSCAGGSCGSCGPAHGTGPVRTFLRRLFRR